MCHCEWTRSWCHVHFAVTPGAQCWRDGVCCGRRAWQGTREFQVRFCTPFACTNMFVTRGSHYCAPHIMYCRVNGTVLSPSVSILDLANLAAPSPTFGAVVAVHPTGGAVCVLDGLRMLWMVGKYDGTWVMNNTLTLPNPVMAPTSSEAAQAQSLLVADAVVAFACPATGACPRLLAVLSWIPHEVLC